MTVDIVDISGIPKDKLLAALHNGTRPIGMGFAHDIGEIDERQARIDIEQVIGSGRTWNDMGLGRFDAGSLYFDYYHGRPLKVDISGDEMDTRLYDRDAGKGTAAKIVEVLRENI